MCQFELVGLNAITECEKDTGQRCYVFAQGEKIVWNGLVTFPLKRKTRQLTIGAPRLYRDPAKSGARTGRKDYPRDDPGNDCQVTSQHDIPWGFQGPKQKYLRFLDDMAMVRSKFVGINR